MNNKPDTIMFAISIGVLVLIFMCALICLILICRRFQQRQIIWDRFDVSVLRKKFRKKHSAEPELAMALNDIGLGNALEHILNDEQWFDDASGLIPHCLDVLRGCYSVTKRVENFTKRPLNGATECLIETAKLITFRVDDVVHSMYPPMDVRLLEARVAALVLSVVQLAVLSKNISILSDQQHLDCIEKGLVEMNDSLMILRKAAMKKENQNRMNINYNQNSLV